jgi:ubiquinone/menaquinone biosynthesis C-methylase UbiE
MMKTRVKIAVNNPLWDIILCGVLMRGVSESIADDSRLAVLEIGCGRGGSTEALLKKLPNSFITAIDIDDAQIKIAERRIRDKRVEFLVEHAVETSFDDEMFDLVTGFNILHHILQWQSSVEEAARVLKPGGRYVVTGITDQGLSNGVFRRFVAPKSIFNLEELIQTAGKCGLALRQDLSNPLYMRLIFQRVPTKPERPMIWL